MSKTIYLFLHCLSQVIITEGLYHYEIKHKTKNAGHFHAKKQNEAENKGRRQIHSRAGRQTKTRRPPK